MLSVYEAAQRHATQLSEQSIISSNSLAVSNRAQHIYRSVQHVISKQLVNCYVEHMYIIEAKRSKKRQENNDEEITPVSSRSTLPR
ncbi:hypothetical protein B9Z55_017528 [Caenorhabditis nigoni]|uniref:Uncharacterized protein n=1 Tax=Caenorhabditis nigoni TaxID=1611254 RepID=A0A2G5TA51_9PELO|nr:hypothetical protein B9Z55_017528 [Caenorhabditis nigoni]